MVANNIPDRGDIVWLNFSPQQGHEQAGLRPAIVLSPKSYNQSSKLMLTCPITSKVTHYPFEVRVKANRIDGVVLADQVKNLDWTMRNMSFVEKASIRGAWTDTGAYRNIAKRLVLSSIRAHILALVCWLFRLVEFPEYCRLHWSQ